MVDLVNGGGTVVSSFGDRDFRDAVVAAFPRLSGDIEPDEGCHFTMTCLASEVMAAVSSENEGRALAVFEFLDGLLQRKDLTSEIPNAVAISFVESGVLKQTQLGRRLLEFMPSRISSLLAANLNQ